MQVLDGKDAEGNEVESEDEYEEDEDDEAGEGEESEIDELEESAEEDEVSGEGEEDEADKTTDKDLAEVGGKKNKVSPAEEGGAQKKQKTGWLCLFNFVRKPKLSRFFSRIGQINLK